MLVKHYDKLIKVNQKYLIIVTQIHYLSLERSRAGHALLSLVTLQSSWWAAGQNKMTAYCQGHRSSHRGTVNSTKTKMFNILFLFQIDFLI